MISNMFRRKVERQVGRLPKAAWEYIWEDHDPVEDEEAEIRYLVDKARRTLELHDAMLAEQHGTVDLVPATPPEETGSRAAAQSTTVELQTSDLNPQEREYAETLSQLYADEVSRDDRVQRLRAFLCSGQAPPALPPLNDKRAEREYERRRGEFEERNGYAVLSVKRASQLLDSPLPRILHLLDYSRLEAPASELCGEIQWDGEIAKLLVTGEEFGRFSRQGFSAKLSVPMRGGGWREIPVRPSSVLAELGDLSRKLAGDYRWQPADIAWLVLTGTVPCLSGVA